MVVEEIELRMTIDAAIKKFAETQDVAELMTALIPVFDSIRWHDRIVFKGYLDEYQAKIGKGLVAKVTVVNDEIHRMLLASLSGKVTVIGDRCKESPDDNCNPDQMTIDEMGKE